MVGIQVKPKLDWVASHVDCELTIGNVFTSNSRVIPRDCRDVCGRHHIRVVRAEMHVIGIPVLVSLAFEQYRELLNCGAIIDVIEG